MVFSDRKNRQDAFPFSALRVLPYQTFPGAINMALDYYLAQSIQTDDLPILRFYGWNPYCLSLGYHQDASLVDFARLRNEGYQAVRRPTGGSAIFHSEELTYALIVPNTNIHHHDIYRLFHHLLAQALQALGYGVDLNEVSDRENYIKKSAQRFACFNRPAFSEIKFAGKKVVGSAQKLYRGALLQHGSILIGPEQRTIMRFLNLDEAKRKKYDDKLKMGSISLSEIKPGPISPLQIAEALLTQFESTLSLTVYFDAFSAPELKHAQKFVDRFKIQ